MLVSVCTKAKSRVYPVSSTNKTDASSNRRHSWHSGRRIPKWAIAVQDWVEEEGESRRGFTKTFVPMEVDEDCLTETMDSRHNTYWLSHAALMSIRQNM
eukprot:5091200-Amphidinium_carterae.1